MWISFKTCVIDEFFQKNNEKSDSEEEEEEEDEYESSEEDYGLDPEDYGKRNLLVSGFKSWIRHFYLAFLQNKCKILGLWQIKCNSN